MHDGKVKLHLGKPTPAALAELYKRLTGKASRKRPFFRISL
jgi:hypothetical protein